MRIAINTRFLIKDKLEGLGLYTWEVVRRLVQNHPDDEFFFLFDRQPHPSFLDFPNVRSVVLFPQARHPILWHWYFQYALPGALKKINPDVFFSPDSYNSLSYQGRSVMVCHDIAFAHSAGHLPFLVDKYYKHFVPKFLQHSTKVAAVSQATLDDIVDTYHVDRKKCFVAPNGVRESFQPLPKNEVKEIRSAYANGEPYFLFVGALHPRKNVARMITAFDEFKKLGKPHQLMIVGRKAWMTSDIKKALDNSPNESEIVFPGFLDESTLAKITGAAFACLYPSLYEGFGVPILEAISCNIPAICSNTSSMPEVAGDAGVLVDPLSITSISEAMKEMVENTALRNNCISACERQAQKYTWDQTATIIYDELK